MARKTQDSYRNRILTAHANLRLMRDMPQALDDAQRAKVLFEALWAFDELMRLRNAVAAIASLDAPIVETVYDFAEQYADA